MKKSDIMNIAAFCTIFYDDYTRSAVTVLIGTAADALYRSVLKEMKVTDTWIKEF